MFIIVVGGRPNILNKLFIVLFNYNVSPHKLPSENKVFIIIIIIKCLYSLKPIYTDSHTTPHKWKNLQGSNKR